MAAYRALLSDLEAEESALDGMVEDLETTALVDEAAFAMRLAELLEAISSADAELTEQGRRMAGGDVLEWWRRARARTLDALREREARERIPWIAGPMSAMSFATARLMETWAHGQDVADGLGIACVPTARLRHVADLGVRTREFSFSVHGLPAPAGDVRVELDAPDGSVWSWGTSRVDIVRGPARDF